MTKPSFAVTAGRRVASALALALLLSPGFAASTAPGSSASTTAPGFVLTLDGQRLSFKGRGVKLHAVLEDLAAKAGLEVHLPGALAEQDVSDSFSELPMDRALGRLLLGTSHVMTYDANAQNEHFIYTTTAKLNYRSGPGVEHPRVGSLEKGARVLVIGESGQWLQIRVPDSESEANFAHSDYLQLSEGSARAQRKNPQRRRIKEVRVLRTGTLLAGAAAENVRITAPPSPSPSAPASSEPATRFYTDPDVQPHLDELFSQMETAQPEEKAALLQAAGSMGPDDARVHAMLVQSLDDADPKVRQGALRSFIGSGNAPPIDPLRQIVLRDSSVELRIEALRVLSQNFPPDTAGEILREASRDADQRVSSRAKKLLEMLGD